MLLEDRPDKSLGPIAYWTLKEFELQLNLLPQRYLYLTRGWFWDYSYRRFGLNVADAKSSLEWTLPIKIGRQEAQTLIDTYLHGLMYVTKHVDSWGEREDFLMLAAASSGLTITTQNWCSSHWTSQRYGMYSIVISTSARPSYRYRHFAYNNMYGTYVLPVDS